MQTARVSGFSGTIVAQMSLGLPALPNIGGNQGQASLPSLLSGSHTMRFWYDGPDRQRLALLGTTNETDLFHSGRDLWQWDSDGHIATHSVLPADHRAPADTTAMTPQQIADRAIKAITPTTGVTVAANRQVADRSAYELVLTPRDTTTLVGTVRIAIDGKTKMPLGVQVFARGSSSPAIDVSFSHVTFKTPAADNFKFTPPPGATVKQGSAAQRPAKPAPGTAPDAAPGATTTIGSGWTSIVEYRTTPAQIAKVAGPVLHQLKAVPGRRWGRCWSAGSALGAVGVCLSAAGVTRTTDALSFAGAPGRSVVSALTTAGGSHPQVTAAISSVGLTKRFGKQVVVDAVDLNVPAGSVYGFLGPNGSGKTTTIRILLGLVFPTAGTHALLDKDFAVSAAEVLPRVGSLVEGPAFHPYLSGRANLARLDAADRSATARTARARIGEALERVGLSAAAGKRYRNYSLGMRQRLGIAAALLQPRELLVLDEPTNGLDPQGTREVRHLITQLGRDGVTVFVSSHLLSEVEQVCSHVGVMSVGRMVWQGALADLAAQQRVRVQVRTARRPMRRTCSAGSGWPRSRPTTMPPPRYSARPIPEHVVAALVAAGVGVRGFVVERPNLEDVFVRAHRGRLRCLGLTSTWLLRGWTMRRWRPRASPCSATKAGSCVRNC